MNIEMTRRKFICVSPLLLSPLLFSCGEGQENVVTPSSSRAEATVTPAEPIQDESEAEEEKFTADFTITLGTHKTGAALLELLDEGKFRPSKWSRQALSNPDFPVAKEEHEVDVVVMTLLDMGFLENELVPLDAILKKGKKLGLEICSPELAVQLRLQYPDQPDWSTGERLGEFFVASEAIDLYDDGVPKIFSVLRDDKFPHEETGIGLWLISNNIIDAVDVNRRDRLFNPADKGGDDLSGRFAFIIPRMMKKK